MSKTADRRHKDEVVIARQLRIARRSGAGNNPDVQQPHRMVKRHAMDCGNTRCPLCANPRTLRGERTIQEQRFYQDLDDGPDEDGTQ